MSSGVSCLEHPIYNTARLNDPSPPLLWAETDYPSQLWQPVALLPHQEGEKLLNTSCARGWRRTRQEDLHTEL